MEAKTCTNCEELIAPAPVFFDGRPYCCVGCIAGGPCLCTYEEPVQPAPQAPRPVVAASDVPSAPQPYRAPAHADAYLIAEAPRPTEPRSDADDQGAERPAADSWIDATPARAPQPSAPPAESRPVAPPSTPRPPGRPQSAAREPYEQPREPIHFRRPGGIAVVVHIGGFANQHQLLAFAGEMEQSPDFAEVSLTRVVGGRAWLTVRAESAEDVAASLLRMPGLNLDVKVDQNLVEARVMASAGPESSIASDQLLPQRPRFRAFRPQPEPGALPTSETALQTPPVATPTTQPAAQPQMQPPVAQPPRPAADRPVTPAPRPTESPTVGAPSMAQMTSAPTAAAAPPTPVARPTPARAEVAEDEFVEPDDHPGGAVMTGEHMTLIVYPFHSFAALNDFHSAIRGLHGVKNTRVRRLYRGTLYLAVDYEDTIPFVDRMADLKDLKFQSASKSRSELEIMLEDQRPLATGGDGSEPHMATQS